MNQYASSNGNEMTFVRELWRKLAVRWWPCFAIVVHARYVEQGERVLSTTATRLAHGVLRAGR
jgi:hypothetical protein